jgi:hypothetical protein
MAKRSIIQPSFAGGEITEALESRDDLAKQKVGLLTCRNAILTSTGSWKNRGGLKYIAEVEDSTKQHRLMSFVFSRLQAYGLVWGDQKLRIIKDGAIVESGGSPVDVVTPYFAANNADLYESQSADVMTLVRSGTKPYNLTRTSDTAWTLTAVDFQDGPWLPFQDGDDDITITPSAKTGAGVTLTASAATFGSCGVGDHVRLGYVNPLDISQIYWAWAEITAIASSTSITVTTQKDFGFEYFLNPDFKDGIGFWENHSNIAGDATVDHVAASQELRFIRSVTPHDAIIRNNITVASQEDLILELVVTQVDTSFRVMVGTTAGAADILGVQIVNSTGTKTWTVRPTQSDIWVTIDTTSQPSGTHKISNASLKRKDLATQNWRLSAWNSDRGWPRTVARHEQRTVWGGNNLDNPDTVWMSKTGEYESFPFSTPSLDTDGLSFTLASDRVNAIQWVIAHGELMVGTFGEEWRVTPGGAANTITPTAIDAKVKSNIGSIDVKPLRVGDSVLFLNRTSDRVYAIRYNSDFDTYKPIDLTILAPHLFDGYTITEWAYQKVPDSVVWMIRSDGKALGLSYHEDQEIFAWSIHDTDGVKRNINGSDVRYLEQLQPRITDEDLYLWHFQDSNITHNTPYTITGATAADPVVITSAGHGLNNGDKTKITDVVGMTELNDNYYLVSNKAASTFELQDLAGVDIDGTGYTAYVSGGEAREAIESWSGLTHLEGETIVAVADGNVNTPKVVASGVIALDNPGGIVVGGLPVTADLKTMPHEAVDSNGAPTHSKHKNVTEVNVYLNKTRGAFVVDSTDNLTELSFLDTDSGANPPPLFTGIKGVTIDGATSKLVNTFIRNTDPVPIEVVGIVTEVEFSDNSDEN